MRNLPAMFTGIIEKTGVVLEIIQMGSNTGFWIESPISSELKVDQSVCHDGVCLTVEEVRGNSHRVTAIAETLKKTNLGGWQKDRIINLERCLSVNGRFDGHIVQGHADCTGICTARTESGGSWEFRFEFPPAFSHLIIEKGSISLNGISLTIYDVKKKRFSVAVIPYTFENTNMSNLLVGSPVNLEFDILGKYIARMVGRKN